MPISFGAGVPWGAVSQTEFRRMARDDRHSLAYRVYFAALGQANRIGHAEFGEGELAALLGSNGKPLTRQGAWNAVDAAKGRDLISSASGVRCLVLGRHQFQKDGLGSGTCSWHSTKGVRAA